MNNSTWRIIRFLQSSHRNKKWLFRKAFPICLALKTPEHIIFIWYLNLIWISTIFREFSSSCAVFLPWVKASCGHEDKWFHGLTEAKSGDSVGVKVSERVRSEDLVYKITDWIIDAHVVWPIHPGEDGGGEGQSIPCVCTPAQRADENKVYLTFAPPPRGRS